MRIKAHPLAPFGIGPPLLDISEKLLGCRLLLVSSSFFRRTSAMFASIVTCISCQCRRERTLMGPIRACERPRVQPSCEYSPAYLEGREMSSLGRPLSPEFCERCVATSGRRCPAYKMYELPSLLPSTSNCSLLRSTQSDPDCCNVVRPV